MSCSAARASRFFALEKLFTTDSPGVLGSGMCAEDGSPQFVAIEAIEPVKNSRSDWYFLQFLVHRVRAYHDALWQEPSLLQ
jgi:hypothetical protein